MRKKEIGVISYISGWEYKLDGGITPIKVGIGHDEVVVMDCTKRFHNCLYLLAGLTPCARNLMDWLTEEMTETNIVYHTAESRRIFNNFLMTITNDRVKYADITIKGAWTDLVRCGLLIPKATRSTFMVHPKFFFKGTDKARIEKIVAKLYFDNKGVDNFKVLSNKKLGI